MRQEEGDDVDQGVLARAAHVPLRAADNTDRIRGWLATCLRTHRKCKNPEVKVAAPRTQPGRMLEIDNDKVKVLCDWSKSNDSGYLALSHMWGLDATKQLRLVMSRLKEFQQEVPWEEIPFTFREAIRIARQVGYKYVWIDS
jgi:hypothetical protein